jgi:ubiquitin thioesterase OTU1
MRARLRAPGGASTINLPDDATIADLFSEITEKTSIVKFDIKYGYPPKPLLIGQSKRSQSLNELGIKLDGEQLTISPKDDSPSSKSGVPSSKQTDLKSTELAARASQESFSFGDITSTPEQQKPSGPVSLQKKSMAGEVPEIPMPERGATLGKFLLPSLRI